MQILKSAGYPEFHCELRRRGSQYEVVKVDHRNASEKRVPVPAPRAQAIATMDDYDALGTMMGEINRASSVGIVSRG